MTAALPVTHARCSAEKPSRSGVSMYAAAWGAKRGSAAGARGGVGAQARKQVRGAAASQGRAAATRDPQPHARGTCSQHARARAHAHARGRARACADARAHAQGARTSCRRRAPKSLTLARHRRRRRCQQLLQLCHVAGKRRVAQPLAHVGCHDGGESLRALLTGGTRGTGGTVAADQEMKLPITQQCAAAKLARKGRALPQGARAAEQRTAQEKLRV